MLLANRLQAHAAKDNDEVERQGGQIYLYLAPAATSHREASAS